MKAAVLYELNRPLKVENISWSTLKRGQVLVKLAYSGVCHSQLMEVRGRRGEDRFLPHLLGHEATGVVQEVGPDVTKVQKSDKVVLGWIKGEGINAEGALYTNDDGVKINSGGVTTFNEYSVVSENRLVKLADGVPLDVGVLFGCAIPTGSGIVTNEAKPKDGSNIAIYGLGGIGLSALMATKLYKCAKVIAIDIEDKKLSLAKEFGATDVINSKKENVLDKINELTNGVGVDYAIEASGVASVIEMAFKSVRNGGGECIFASHPKAGDMISLDPFDLICGKKIRGSWGGACNPDRDLPKFFELYLEGVLPLEKLIEKSYKIDEINQALDDLEDRKVLRPLIEIDTTIK
jgi:S-(hydroxymethyl)glutathione dehydrogenase/alcohol dehydrogenase